MVEKKKIALSINPTYSCNLNCSFCYLEKTCNNILDLLKLEDELLKISGIFNIIQIELYGGEIFILDDCYLMKLILICKKFTKKISIITNGTIDKPWLFNFNGIEFNISWDYIYRDKSDLAFNMIKKYSNTGIILTSPQLYKKRYEVVNILNTLDGNHSIDVKLCMPSNNNKSIVLDLYGYEEFILYLRSTLNNNLNLIQYQNFKNNKINNEKIYHCFIDPNCKLKKLEFKNNIEYFNDEDIEDIRINEDCDNHCSICLAEHKFKIQNSYDCLGMKKLIEKFEALAKYDSIKNWRKRRLLSYMMNNNDYKDSHLDYFEIKLGNDDLKRLVISFFENSSNLIYPAKSYYVAILYAWMLNKYFGEDIKIALDYPDLLNYDDNFFIRYSLNKEFYDSLLDVLIPNLNSGQYKKSIESTVSYFNKEFLIS